MYKYLTANNTFNYIDTLDGTVRKYNNTIHSSIGMKPKDAALNKTLLRYIMHSMKIINQYIHSINLIKEIK